MVSPLADAGISEPSPPMMLIEHEFDATPDVLLQIDIASAFDLPAIFAASEFFALELQTKYALPESEQLSVTLLLLSTLLKLGEQVVQVL